MGQLKGELVQGLMQLQILEILKAKYSSRELLHTSHDVCQSIMHLEKRMLDYVKLLGSKNEHDKEQLKEIRASIRSIGENLNAMAGIELMLACCYLVSYSCPEDDYESYLNRIWDGIGGWAA